jgi:hypothetical protein
MAITNHLYGPPKVGGDTLAFCTRCKMELAHVIVSMVDRRPAKVLCKTCKTQHIFRHSSPTKSTSSSRSRPSPKLVISAAELWQKKIQNTQVEVKPYRIQDKYSLGNLIQHGKFGVGVVEEIKRNGKILVLFREGEKTLVHGLEA